MINIYDIYACVAQASSGGGAKCASQTLHSRIEKGPVLDPKDLLPINSTTDPGGGREDGGMGGGHSTQAAFKPMFFSADMETLTLSDVMGQLKGLVLFICAYMYVYVCNFYICMCIYRYGYMYI